MKNGLSRLAGGWVFACAGILACGGHATEGPDPSTGAGGSAGSRAPADGSMALDGSTADRAFFDGRNQPQPDANSGRGGSSSIDASSATDASVATDGSTAIDVAMDGFAVVDITMQDRAVVDMAVHDRIAGDGPIADASEDTGGCTLDHCRTLAHVAPGAPVECRSGQCYIPPSSCLRLRSLHQQSNGRLRDELFPTRDVWWMYGALPRSFTLHGGAGLTIRLLPADLPASLRPVRGPVREPENGPLHCAACNHVCTFDNAEAKCEDAKCVVDRCFDPDHTADCTDAPGCETTLGTRDNCMSCGDKACAGINTALTCNVDSSCASAACAAGYANCDATAGCEAAVASATCVLRYAGTTVVGTRSNGRLPSALAGDESYVIGGSFESVIDFDPSAAMDVRTPAPGCNDGFITKFNADGSYGWTRTLSGVASDGGFGATRVEAVALQQDGAIVAAGWYRGAVDFDPGPQTDIHVTFDPAAGEPFVVKLSATGTLVWVRTFVVSAWTFDVASALAVDEGGGVYVGGTFSGTVDFDPGSGSDARTANGQSAFVVKLDSGGSYVWARTSAAWDPGISCLDSVYTIALARDGVVWVGGTSTCGFNPAENGGGAMLAGLSMVSGSVQASYFVGSPSDVISGVAIAPDASLYCVGSFFESGDFDPGVGVVERKPLGPAPAGFVLNLGADGALRWVQTIPEATLNAVAVLNDGSVVVVGSGPTGVWKGMPILRWKADHTPAWSLVAGSTATVPSVVAVGAAGFIVTGVNDGSGDFDPGAGDDIVVGGVSFISRYAF